MIKIAKNNLRKRNLNLAELLNNKNYLEIHAATTKEEIQQLKIALRVTRQRIRRINSKIELARNKNKPKLRLVYSASD